MPSNHFIPCHPLFPLPSFFCSIRVFYNESVLCIRWPKYRSFSFSISPSNEYSGLISFKFDWLDLLAGIALMFLALAGRFRFTLPPGKSIKNFENRMVCLGSRRFSDSKWRQSEAFLLPQWGFWMAESPPCVGDAEYKGLLSPGLFFLWRSGAIGMPASYCTLMIEPHLLVGTVTVLDLHSCSFSLHVVRDSGLAPRTGSPPSGLQSSPLLSSMFIHP